MHATTTTQQEDSYASRVSICTTRNVCSFASFIASTTLPPLKSVQPTKADAQLHAVMCIHESMWYLVQGRSLAVPPEDTL